jgi:hypothetical protein
VLRTYARAPQVCPAIRVYAHALAVPRAVRVTSAVLGASARVVRSHIGGPYD